ncbi:MAG TPA: alpha/beta fold hydrolase [Mycobacteriales bacterium]|nr:alpha/beta fold hydrolase [Mycobacteriales bacterium]
MSPVELYHRDTGSGPALVLLHAFPLSSAMWLAQREALNATHRVITPDQRGFGGSPLGEEPPSLDLVADDLAALLDAKDLGSVVLGGLSMGGYVAMAFLRRHPDRVRGLVLADTKAGPDTPKVRANRERIAEQVIDDASLLIEEVFPTLLGPTSVASRPLVLGRVKALVQAAPPVAVAWAQRAMAARPDSFATLRAVAVPTLVVVGEEDTLAPPAEARAMADAVPRGRLVALPGAGHLSAVEAPEEFNAALAGFLAELGSARG